MPLGTPTPDDRKEPITASPMTPMSSAAKSLASSGRESRMLFASWRDASFKHRLSLGRLASATSRHHRSGNLPPAPVADHRPGKSGRRGVGQYLDLRRRLSQCTRDESLPGPWDRM